jgi:hypothetical protein
VPLTPENSAGAAGTVPAGGTDSSVPVKIGGLVTTGTPTLRSTGQVDDIWLGSLGNLIIGCGPGSSDAQNAGSLLDPTGASRIIGSGSFLYNGASWDRARTPTTFKSVNALLITAEQTVWTPAGGKKFRLMGFVLTQGVLTGAITLKDNTAGTTILVIPPTTVGVAFASPPMGNGFLSAAANNVLTATGVATETITGYFFGTEE